MELKRGVRFESKQWMNKDMTPLKGTITTIRQKRGRVYYKIDNSDIADWFPIKDAEKYVGRIL